MNKYIVDLIEKQRLQTKNLTNQLVARLCELEKWNE